MRYLDDPEKQIFANSLRPSFDPIILPADDRIELARVRTERALRSANLSLAIATAFLVVTLALNAAIVLAALLHWL